MKKYKRIKSKEYKQIKSLLGLGLTLGKIELITGRTYPTLIHIRNTKNWEDFKPKEIEPKATNGSHTEIPKSDTIVSLLERIANSVERLEKKGYTYPGGNVTFTS